MSLIPNTASPEGRELGFHLARLCNKALQGRQDNRCATCAFRNGEHLANGSGPTLMNAVKCLMENKAFHCHEHDRVCAGYLAMCDPKSPPVEMPWGFVEGTDQP
jgi:hypothetical protein